MTIRDDRGRERRLPGSEVGRVYFASSAATPTSTPDEASPQGDVVVHAGRQWTSTGIEVQRDETLRFTSTGQLFLGINDDGLADNQGEFRVAIQRGTTPIRRRRWPASLR